jgi:hypothetical protein
VSPLVVRSDKRRTTDSRGQALFQPRNTVLRIVPYGGRAVEQTLYEAVTDYVRFGYQKAKTEKRPAVGFLVLLMQRLASSSTAAVLSALERRHGAIVTEGTQLRLFPDRAEEWGDLSGEEQVDALQGALGAAWGNELAEVEVLINLARRATADGLDAKARNLLGLLDDLARTDGDPSLKAVIFTEFTQTQRMLLGVLEGAGIEAVAINGSMGIHDRARVQEQFRDQARVLVSTDAGGEGINLQFAHVIINYDLPWSPSRIEQRIGRVDRIGQTHPVQAINLAMEHSIDARVLEVLQTKLAVILAELGADKAGDILNSADRHAEDLYTASIMKAHTSSAATEFESRTRAEAAEAATFLELVDTTAQTPTIGGGPDPEQWIQSAMAARRKLFGDGEDSTSVWELLPEVSPVEPVPTITGTRPGSFSLWEVTRQAGDKTCIPVFLTTDGAARPDLAERVWSELISGAEVSAEAPLESEAWNSLWDAGWGYAVRPDQANMASSPPPGLVLRLLVKVQP